MTRRGPWWKPRSLRRQLMVGVTTIVSLALIGVGAVAVMSLRDEAMRLTDSKVSDAGDLQLLLHQTRCGGGGHRGVDRLPGRALGTVIAVLRGDSVVYATVFGDGEPKAAPADAQQALGASTCATAECGPSSWATSALPGRKPGTRQRRTAGVGGVPRPGQQDIGAGDGHRHRAGAARIAGHRGRHRVDSLLCAAALRRVAEVAGEVAALPLTSQEHRITARVAESDTDPGNEVGIVGNTLNRLLANVDGALADLAASDRRMRRFLADASHELRTRWRRSWDTPS